MLLVGMKIVSFCHFLQGPAAMQYLGDMGAEIIKIEPPQGAYERHWAGAGRVQVGGVSAFYLSANRNARSIAIDLKKRDATEVVMRLVGDAHAVAENFRPGTLDRLGLGYAAVKARKSDIIYASASGYGADGPYAKRPGQDLLIQAMSGLVAANGGGTHRHTAIGCAAVDQHGGALLALGILGAYVKWLKTGEGTHVEASLLNSGIDLQIESLVTYYAAAKGDRIFDRQENLATWFHEAPYGIYTLADAKIAVSLNPLDKVARALDTDAFNSFIGADPFIHRDAIATAVAKELKDRFYADIAKAFDAEAMWYAKVDNFDDLPNNPQLQHNGVFNEIDVNGVATRVVNHPNRYDGKRPEQSYFALEQGADTRSILEEAGFVSTEITELMNDGVVFAPK